MSHLLRSGVGVAATFAITGDIFRAENRAMVEECGIEYVPLGDVDASGFRSAVLVDTQPGFGHTEVPGGLPVLAVVDHHEGPGVGPAGIPFYDVRRGYGATSTIVFEYLDRLGVDLPVNVATALLCGLRFDTADLGRNASPSDEGAYVRLLHVADLAAYARIKSPPLSSPYFHELRRALAVARVHGPILLAFLGKISNPDMVAEMADLFLRHRETSWTLVGGLYEGTYYLSLRTDSPDQDAYPLIRGILDGEGTCGGHGRIAGGRIPVPEGEENGVYALQRRLRARALALAKQPKRGGRRLA
jgi:nanoRNase/pAp phosphatase (c-di-AMP/oligoRNAs hydrolase)